ncbi:MAG: glycosyltransferase family 39 protein [Chloroflexi bacterium]|nr:glycosyltransferase family 39 protein [Chloroflexota bacterium]
MRTAMHSHRHALTIVHSNSERLPAPVSGLITAPDVGALGRSMSFKRFPFRQVTVIVGAGIALRLLVMWAIWHNGGNPLIGDEGNYILSALPLSEGRGIPDLWLWVRAPGYIFFSAATFALSGGSLFALNIAQALLSGPVAVAAYFLGAAAASDEALRSRAGVWAAALVAFNPILVFNDNFFLSEQLFTLLVELLLLALLAYARTPEKNRRAWARLAVAGLCMGAALLTRSNLAFFVPFVLLWLAFREKRTLASIVGRLALFLGTAAVVILPWTARNLAQYGHFIPIDTSGAYVFYLDNTDLSQQQAKSDLSNVSNQGERQSYALARALSWVGEHKAEFLTRALGRIANAWSVDPFTDLRYPVRDKIPGAPTWGRDLYALGASLGYLLITVAAIAGFIWAPRSSLKTLALLFILAYLLTLGLSHNEFRYRLPVIALVSAFGGYALAHRGTFWPLRGAASPRWRALASLLCGLLFITFSLPLIVPGLIASIEAQRLELQGLLAGTLEQRAFFFERAADKDAVSSWPLREAGRAREALGDSDKATGEYEQAIAREPGDWRSRALVSLLDRAKGDLNRSIKVGNGVPAPFNAVMQEWAWERSGAPGAEVDVGGADMGWVKGFYIGETGDDAGTKISYRWSGEDAWVKVGRQPGDKELVIRARALPAQGGEPLKVSYRINGQDVGSRSMDAQMREYRFDIPQGAGDTVALEIIAPARRPAPEDNRDLAVAVDWVKTMP